MKQILFLFTTKQDPGTERESPPRVVPRVKWSAKLVASKESQNSFDGFNVKSIPNVRGLYNAAAKYPGSVSMYPLLSLYNA
jgi:hypothetical protein